MRKAFLLLLVIIIILSIIRVYFYFRDSGKNNRTDVGWFWYDGAGCDEGCDIKYSYYKNIFKSGENYVIHLVALRSDDDEVMFHFGQAVYEKDTLKLHIQEKYKFHLSGEIMRSTCLPPTNFYFTSKVYPKTITLQFDSYDPFPLDSLPTEPR
jgi:hypothetical protein